MRRIASAVTYAVSCLLAAASGVYAALHFGEGLSLPWSWVAFAADVTLATWAGRQFWRELRGKGGGLRG